MNERTVSPSGDIVKDPNFVLVCDSKTGSCTFTLIAATKPPRISGASKFFFVKSRMVLTKPSRNAA